jgi:hypothetical protein
LAILASHFSGRWTLRRRLLDYFGGRGVNAAGVPAVKDFIFKVNLVAVARVRAANENIARQVVPTVLGAPGNAEIAMANQNNAATGHDARVRFLRWIDQAL